MIYWQCLLKTTFLYTISLIKNNVSYCCTSCGIINFVFGNMKSLYTRHIFKRFIFAYLKRSLNCLKDIMHFAKKNVLHSLVLYITATSKIFSVPCSRKKNIHWKALNLTVLCYLNILWLYLFFQRRFVRFIKINDWEKFMTKTNFNI